MSGVLQVCRLGPNWAVKDSSGAFWDVSASRESAEAAAARRARGQGLRVVVRDVQGVQR